MNENMSAGNSRSEDFDSEDFFEQLDQEVNSVVVGSDTKEVTAQESPTEQVTQQVADSDSGTADFEKRYKDSSREAQKMRETLNKYEPFMPVLDAMKKDPGMVQTVKNYLTDKQSPPKNVVEALKLDEDFVFDADEAMQTPDSDSAKVFNHMVDRVVQTRLGEAQKRQQEYLTQTQREQALSREKNEFLKTHKMNNEEFENFANEAKQRKVTLEDIYYILNRNKAAQNIDTNARKDVMRQMKNAQTLPTSVSGASNVGDKSTDDQMFESLLGIDGGVDNMFG